MFFSFALTHVLPAAHPSDAARTTVGPKKAALAAVASGGLAGLSTILANYGPVVFAIALLVLWAAGSFALVAIAFSGIGLRVFRRRAGELSLRSLVLLFPYLAPSWLFHAWRRTQTGPSTEIAPNVFLGGYPWGKGPWHAVLDMTSEYPSPSAPAGAAYLNIPCVDGVAVPSEALKAGSDFIEQQWRSGPVLIHCAIGRYRSARAVAQWLQDYQGLSERDAWRLLRDKRPLVRPPKHLLLL